MKLMVNSDVQDVVYSPNEYVTLFPRYGMDLTNSNNRLRLRVDGSVLVHSIEIRLRPNHWDWSDGHYDQIHLPMDVDQIMYDYDVIDLDHYVDLSAYNGYRVIGIEVDVDAHFANQNLYLLVNGYVESQVVVRGTGQHVTLFPEYGTVLGSDIESLMLYTDGGGALDIRGVTLRLSRY